MSSNELLLLMFQWKNLQNLLITRLTLLNPGIVPLIVITVPDATITGGFNSSSRNYLASFAARFSNFFSFPLAINMSSGFFNDCCMYVANFVICLGIVLIVSQMKEIEDLMLCCEVSMLF